jgi:hypothetical protein
MLTVIVCGFFLSPNLEVSRAEYNRSPIIYIQTISNETNWTRANSPINLNGNVFVQEGATLTIEAGVTVNFQRFILQVNGTLKVLGTADNNVFFTNTNAGLEDFHAQHATIYLGDDSVNNDVEYAVFSTLPLTYYNCKSPLTLNYVKFDSGPIIRGTGQVTITNCFFTSGLQIWSPSTIINNTFSGGQGIDAENGDFVIQNNTILGTRSPVQGFGLSLTRYTNNARAVISDNVISGYAEACIKIDGPALIQRNLLQSPPNRDGYPFFGIEVDGSSPTIQNNTITKCGIGICIYNQGIEETKPTITNNNIYDNVNGNLYLGYPPRPNYNPSDFITDTNSNINSSGTLNGAGNWWGTIDIAKILQTIHDQNLPPALSSADFTPFLTAPNPKATPNPTLSKVTLQLLPPNYYLQVNTGNSHKADLTLNGDLVVYSNAPINVTIQNGNTKLDILVRGDTDQAKFINITIPKSVVLAGSTPQISFQDHFKTPTVQTQSYSQDADNYYVWATMHFSGYFFGNLFITFTDSSTQTSNDYTTVLLIGGVVTIVGIMTGLAIFWHRKRRMGQL